LKIKQDKTGILAGQNSYNRAEFTCEAHLKRRSLGLNDASMYEAFKEHKYRFEFSL
jgi:hypothetical protein